jgi:uncharacterized phage protein (TIGR01671 family)
MNNFIKFTAPSGRIIIQNINTIETVYIKENRISGDYELYVGNMVWYYSYCAAAEQALEEISEQISEQIITETQTVQHSITYRGGKSKAWWNNKMYYVAGILFATQQEGEPEWENWGVPKQIALMDDPEQSKLSWHDAKECILLQATGVFDKNGVEICEGDIVNLFKERWTVIYWEGAYWAKGFVASLQEEELCQLRDIHTEIEIIGNKFENPELCSKN